MSDQKRPSAQELIVGLREQALQNSQLSLQTARNYMVAAASELERRVASKELQGLADYLVRQADREPEHTADSLHRWAETIRRLHD